MPRSFSLVYGTNIWTHHQVPVATELARIMEPGRFRMAIFEEVHDERRKMGWGGGGGCPWLIGPPGNQADRALMLRECLEADVMVFGACPMDVLQARTAAGKTTLVAAERLLKKPFHRLRMLNPRYAAGIRRYRSQVNHPRIHALAIGRYAADDLQTIGAFGDRIWRWGYFVDVNPEPPAPAPDRPVKILWAGRMLDWKRVDILLRALARIQDSQWFGGCAIIGDGPERERLLGLSRRLALDSKKVCFQPSVPFEEVRRLMRESDIYVLPSNRHEGWGAVAGEAMSEGCVLVANVEAGSAQELVVDGSTGFLFRDGDAGRLASLLGSLADDYQLRMEVRRRAWQRLQALWHPRVAAERLVSLCAGLVRGRELPDFSEGPCSRARNRAE